MALNKKVLGAVFKKSTGEGLSSKLIPFHFTPGAAIGITAGATAITGGTELFKSGQENKLGKISMAENLDRLYSVDGSGFAENANRVSRGDPQVMDDIVKHTFNSYNQWGADGSIVFALHNLREG